MKILIAVPTFDHKIDADCFKSIYGLDGCGYTVQFDYVKGYNAARARRMMALEAIEHGFDYMLSVDSDMILPSNTIPLLLSLAEARHGIAFGWYHRRQWNTDNTETFMWRDGEQNFGEHNVIKTQQMVLMDKAFRIKGAGLGCAMIKVKLFKDIPQPWFEFIDYNRTLEDNPSSILDDSTSFCAKCEAVGLELWCHPQVRALHITDITL
jgi:hypothetical protein